MTYNPLWFQRPLTPLTTSPLIIQDDGDVVAQSVVPNIGGMTFDPGADPPAAGEGAVRFNFTDKVLEYHDGSAWVPAAGEVRNLVGTIDVATSPGITLALPTGNKRILSIIVRSPARSLAASAAQFQVRNAAAANIVAPVALTPLVATDDLMVCTLLRTNKVEGGGSLDIVIPVNDGGGAGAFVTYAITFEMIS